MSFAATALRMSAGVIVWALHFGLIYGITGLACARGSPRAALIGIGVATAVAVAVLLPVIVTGWRGRDRFEASMSGALGAFALVAVLWEALPAVLIEACT